MFGQIYFRVLGIGCFLSMALLSSAQSKLDSLHHLNEVVVIRGSIQNVAWTKCRTKYVKPLVHR